VRITAQVPLAELGDYQTTLKSLTGGAGTFTMELDHYETAPAPVQKELESAFRPTADD
jgi:elongation factor G